MEVSESEDNLFDDVDLANEGDEPFESDEEEKNNSIQGGQRIETSHSTAKDRSANLGESSSSQFLSPPGPYSLTRNSLLSDSSRHEGINYETLQCEVEGKIAALNSGDSSVDATSPFIGEKFIPRINLNFFQLHRNIIVNTPTAHLNFLTTDELLKSREAQAAAAVFQSFTLPILCDMGRNVRSILQYQEKFLSTGRNFSSPTTPPSISFTSSPGSSLGYSSPNMLKNPEC